MYTPTNTLLAMASSIHPKLGCDSEVLQVTMYYTIILHCLRTWDLWSITYSLLSEKLTVWRETLAVGKFGKFS